MRILKRHALLNLSAILLVTGLLQGCGSTGGRNSPPPNPVSPQPQQTEQPSTPAPALSSGPRPQFYDFPDIPIPMELKLVSDDSSTFQSGDMKSGILTLRGRVDLNSVVNFFQMAMPRENWKPKGGFRYRRSILIYEKPEKTCVINLYEKMYYTYVEIVGAPASGQI